MSNASHGSLLGKIADYTEILVRDPNSKAFVPLSETYRLMGLLDDALEVVEKGLQAHPRHSIGYTALGRIQAERRAFDEAASAFEQALRLDGENLSALRGLTRLRLREGDKGAARDLLQRILTVKPGDRTARDLLHKLGGEDRPPVSAPEKSAAPSKGTTPSQQAGGKGGEPISTPTIAELYVRQGFPRRAMRVYRDLLAADPENEALRRKLVALKKQIASEQAASADSPAPAAERPTPREKAAREMAALEQAAREQAAREQAAREQAAREQAAREQAAREQAAREQAAREQAAREQAAREQAAREKTALAFDRWLESIHRRRQHVR